MTNAIGNPNVAREMSPFRQATHKARVALTRFRRRFIPMLVWWGDEIDVVVTFKENKLRASTLSDALADFNRGSLHEAKKILNEIEYRV